MCSQKSKESYNRRDFLKAAGGTSAVIASSLSTGTLRGSDSSQSILSVENCTFSALPKDFVYLNSGTEGSMSDCVISSLQLNQKKWASNPTHSYETDETFGKRQELNRQKVANFIGVDKDNVTLTDNTTMGLSMALLGLNFKPGDFVVTTNHEHNAIRSPLQTLHERIGLAIKTRSFPSALKLKQMTADELLDYLFPNIELLRNAAALCVSHVYPSTGIRLPLKALREKADSLNIKYLIVDGAQAFGMLDVSHIVDESEDDISHSDFYACPGHKWLNGPPSTGILYIKNEHIRPPEFYPIGSQRMGKYSQQGDGKSTFYPMAKALQVRGCSNTVGFSAMVSALDFIDKSGGSSAVEKHILKLSNQVKTLIKKQAPLSLISPFEDASLTSGLTVFSAFKWQQPSKLFTDKKTADWVVAELLAKNIQIRSISLDDMNKSGNNEKLYVLRVSTAHFTTQSDIEIFKVALQDVLQRIG